MGSRWGRLRFSTAAAVSPYRFGRLPLHRSQRIIRIPYQASSRWAPGPKVQTWKDGPEMDRVA